MCSIYEAIRRVALGENPRMVLMDMVHGEEDGGEAFVEEDDELDSDQEEELDSDEDNSDEDNSDEDNSDEDIELMSDKSDDINPDDIPETELN